MPITPFNANHPSTRVLFIHRFEPRRVATGPASTTEVLVPEENTTMTIFFIVSVPKTSVKQLDPAKTERIIPLGPIVPPSCSRCSAVRQSPRTTIPYGMDLIITHDFDGCST